MTPHKPILFSTEMVQAILDGKKSMTRRTKGLENVAKDVTEIAQYDETDFIDTDLKSYKCPYGNVGDLLWVRETWGTWRNEYYYKASTELGDEVCKWKPSIHMPKAAARIWLKIEEIRVERLEDISEEDAINEGVIKDVKWHKKAFETPELIYRHYYDKDVLGCADARSSFMSLWYSINGEESWKANPWVWVIKFSRTEKPSDV